MKKRLIITSLLVSLFIASLSGCHTEKAKNTQPKYGSHSVTAQAETDTPEASASSAPASTAWAGIGQQYKLSAVQIPEDTEQVLLVDGSVFPITAHLDDAQHMQYEIVQDAQSIYSATGVVMDYTSAENGIWVAEWYADPDATTLRLIAPDGTNLNTIDVASSSSSEWQVYTVDYLDGLLYLLRRYAGGSPTMDLLKPDGSDCGQISLPAAYGYAVPGSDDVMYYVQKTDSGNLVYQLDAENETANPLFSVGNGSVFSGTDEYPLLLNTKEGIYGLSSDGEQAPILIFSECKIFLGIAKSLLVLPNGGFYYLTETGANLLLPCDDSSNAAKQELTIAAIGSTPDLSVMAERFNAQSEEYTVRIIDYTNDGDFSDREAKTRLTTELISGRLPDMLCFSALSPFPYISKGLLMDLTPLFAEDPELALDDLVISNALTAQGGMYVASGEFFFETLVGLPSRFGNQCGWTLQDYLQIESAVSDDIQTIYNMTKEGFLKEIAARYIRTAVDWENGRCYFDCDDFIEILQASARIRENPESASGISFAYGPSEVGKGKWVAALSWVNTVWKLAYEEKMAGCALSFIGWPTIDGSCGSDIILTDPVGIVAQSEHTDGSWTFIKYMIQNTEESDQNGLPVYRPLLETMCEAAKEDSALPVKFRDTDQETLFKLLDAAENIAMYDEQVLSIIMDESSAFLNGGKGATETAKAIQSRVSLYLAEQQ